MTTGDVALERTLIYDADCGFCTRSANWLAKTGKVSIKPWQGIRDLEALGLTEEMVETAAYWADGGEVRAAAESAIARALIARGRGWSIAGRFILAVRPLAAPVYKVIAKNRHAMPGGTDACRLPS
jgi:predicted DCC family thiol-disulfide oxidoreductase YuxK